MGAAVVGMGVAHALLLAAHVEAILYLGVCLGGLAYGAFWSLIPTLTGELFGMKAYASIYSSFAMAVSLGSLVLSTTLASSNYDAHIATAPPAAPPPLFANETAPPSPPSTSKMCYGGECYQLTHLIVIGLCTFAALCMAALTARTRAFYAATVRVTPAAADTQSGRRM